MDTSDNHMTVSLIRGLLNDRSVPKWGGTVFGGVEQDNKDFEELFEEITSVREILKQFSCGNFDQEITVRGALAGYLKTLQANLRHLTWQVEQVAAGDFTQRVDFMGNFSQAFNTMTVRMEQLLKDSRERERQLLLDILNSCPVCFTILVNGTIRFATPFLKRFLDIDVDARLDDYLVSPESGNRLMEELDTEQVIVWRPLLLQTKSGEKKEMLAHLFHSDYYDERGTMIWLVDVTQIRQVETDLRKAKDLAEESARLKGEFLARISHEIRTPMNAILGITHLIRQTSLSEQQSDYLATMEKSARMLLSIINDILDFSEIEAGKMKLDTVGFSLSKLIHEALSAVRKSAESKQLSLFSDIASDIPSFVAGDPVRLEQILLNLLNNAVKFTQEGQIRFRARIDHQDEENVTVLFSISDTGIGIPEEHFATLFTPFTQADNSMTRRFDGAGLGLAISHNLVAAMNGRIWCESRVNEGTTFYFTACFARSAVSSSGKLGPPADEKTEERNLAANADIASTKDRRVEIPESLQGLSILLVEDNKINQLVAVGLLKTKGFSVDVAANGRLAVEMVGRKNYGIVLMDLQMPEMDGFEATRLIRQNPQWTDLPILAMTANTMPGDRERCLDAGMNDHIAKPIDPTTLYQNIIRWAKPSTEPESLR